MIVVVIIIIITVAIVVVVVNQFPMRVVGCQSDHRSQPKLVIHLFEPDSWQPIKITCACAHALHLLPAMFVALRECRRCRRSPNVGCLMLGLFWFLLLQLPLPLLLLPLRLSHFWFWQLIYLRCCTLPILVFVSLFCTFVTHLVNGCCEVWFLPFRYFCFVFIFPWFLVCFNLIFALRHFSMILSHRMLATNIRRRLLLFLLLMMILSHIMSVCIYACLSTP